MARRVMRRRSSANHFDALGMWGSLFQIRCRRNRLPPFCASLQNKNFLDVLYGEWLDYQPNRAIEAKGSFMAHPERREPGRTGQNSLRTPRRSSGMNPAGPCEDHTVGLLHLVPSSHRNTASLRYDDMHGDCNVAAVFQLPISRNRRPGPCFLSN
jgi:hypothetical protein